MIDPAEVVWLMELVRNEIKSAVQSTQWPPPYTLGYGGHREARQDDQEPGKSS